MRAKINTFIHTFIHIYRDRVRETFSSQMQALCFIGLSRCCTTTHHHRRSKVHNSYQFFSFVGVLFSCFMFQCVLFVLLKRVKKKRRTAFDVSQTNTWRLATPMATNEWQCSARSRKKAYVSTGTTIQGMEMKKIEIYFLPSLIWIINHVCVCMSDVQYQKRSWCDTCFSIRGLLIRYLKCS